MLFCHDFENAIYCAFLVLIFLGGKLVGAFTPFATMGFNLNVAIVVDSFFSTSSFVGEVNILPQSEGDLCVVIFHLNSKS